MQLPALHRKLSDDALALHAVVDGLFPAQIPPHYDGKPVSIKRFIKRLNVVTEPLGVFNEIKLDKEVSPGLIFNTALWLGKEELPENDSHAAIRVLWHLNPVTKRVVLTQTEWSRRRYYFWQMILHELIHVHRWANKEREPRIYRPTSTQRNVKEEQAYYGSTDEIETHAHAAAVEFHIWWPQLPYRDAMREAITYSGRVLSPTAQMYMTAFADTPGHPAIRHFRRKVRAWYTVIRLDWVLYETLQLPNLVG